LNTALLHLTDADWKGRLQIKRGQLEAVCGDIDGWHRRHDVSFLLTHHGIDWLTRKAGEEVQRDILDFTVHLFFGHKHDSFDANYSARGAFPQLRYQASSLFGMERQHGYAAGRIQFNSIKNDLIRLWPRQLLRSADRWVFVPDYGTYELEADQGTFVAPLHVVPIATTISVPSSQTDRGGGVPAHKPKVGTQPTIFLSYAWGDDTDPGLIRDQAAEAIFSWLKTQGYDARRDKQDLRSGDLISEYETTIGVADHIVVVLSDKYLRSAYSMAELHNIHEHCLRDRGEFLRRVTCVMLQDAAKIRDDLERLKYAQYWKTRYEEMYAALTELGIEAIGLRTSSASIRFVTFGRRRTRFSGT